jgi:hypothetical protein
VNRTFFQKFHVGTRQKVIRETAEMMEHSGYLCSEEHNLGHSTRRLNDKYFCVYVCYYTFDMQNARS